jgi:PAS domain S-box-containing protein
MLPTKSDAPLSDHMLRQMADHVPSVMVVVTVPGLRIAYANRAAGLAADAAAPDLASRPVAEVFAFVDAEMLTDASRSGVTQAGLAGDGTMWWEVSYAPLDMGEPDLSAVLVTATDVTARETARIDARGARDTLDALLAYIPEGISISQGPEVRVVHISARGVALTGRGAAELTGRSVLREPAAWDVWRPGGDAPVPPEDRPLAHATRTGEVRMNQTLLIHRPDGSVLPVLCNSGPIRDAAGRITGAVLAWHDISELQHAQAALRDSEERLRAVLLQVPAAIFIVEAPDGRLTFKSRLVDEVLGHPSSDLTVAQATLQGWAVHADGSPYALPEYPSRRALYDGETVRAEPMIYARGDGRMINLEMYAGPVRDAAGEIVAAVAVALDVTERKHAAERLRESEARLRVALEAGGLGTWEVDPLTNTNHIGRSLAVMLGLPPEPVALDRAVSGGFIHPDDRERVAAAFARAMAEGEDYVNEFRAQRTDGEARWLTAHGRIIRAIDGSPVRAVGVIRDVTDRRAREDRLREAAEARELLLREADHRIKNSLQLVGSLLGLQRSRLSDPDAVAALDGAIARVMAISEAHRALHQSVDLRHIALDEMLRDLCAHVGTLNPALNFLCDCPAGVELDTERAIPLGLVVSELLTNAAKHAYPSGRPSAGGEVRTAGGLADGSFEIVVSDGGVGMGAPASSRARLGSTIVRSLVGQIGATMEVISAPGQGTRTRLRFAQRA